MPRESWDSWGSRGSWGGRAWGSSPPAIGTGVRRVGAAGGREPERGAPGLGLGLRAVGGECARARADPCGAGASRVGAERFEPSPSRDGLRFKSTTNGPVRSAQAEITSVACARWNGSTLDAI